MVNKAKMKKIMKQFTPKRAKIASAGGEPLELPNYSGAAHHSRTHNIDMNIENLKADHIAEKTTGHDVVVDNDVDLGSNDLTSRRLFPSVGTEGDPSIDFGGLCSGFWFDNEDRIGASIDGSNIIKISDSFPHFKVDGDIETDNLKTTGNANIGGDAVVTGNVGGGTITTDRYYYVDGDPDTYISFGGNDQFNFYAGGWEVLRFNIAKGVGQMQVNPGNVDVDFYVKTDGGVFIIATDASAEILNFGDGGVTNYTQFDTSGNLTFNGSAGLPFANIYAQDNAVATTITTAGKANKVQITIFDTDGPSNNATPDHTNDHITITKAGHYMATVALTVSGDGGDTDKFGFSLWKNNGDTEFANVHGHRNMSGGAGDIGSVHLSGIIDLAVNDTIEVWTWNEDDTHNTTIDDISLSLVQIGGT